MSNTTYEITDRFQVALLRRASLDAQELVEQAEAQAAQLVSSAIAEVLEHGVGVKVEGPVKIREGEKGSVILELVEQPED